jgi:hypothetical protein
MKSKKNVKLPARWRLVAGASTLITSCTLGIAAPAQAANDPDFTCPDRTICFFQGDNFNGNVAPLGTSFFRDEWLSLTDLGLTIPWGSVNNKSDSCTLVSNASGSSRASVLPHVRFDSAHIPSDVRHEKWIFIEYGNPRCNKSDVPPPP